MKINNSPFTQTRIRANLNTANAIKTIKLLKNTFKNISQKNPNQLAKYGIKPGTSISDEVIKKFIPKILVGKSGGKREEIYRRDFGLDSKKIRELEGIEGSNSNIDIEKNLRTMSRKELDSFLYKNRDKFTSAQVSDCLDKHSKIMEGRIKSFRALRTLQETQRKVSSITGVRIKKVEKSADDVPAAHGFGVSVKDNTTHPETGKWTTATNPTGKDLASNPLGVAVGPGMNNTSGSMGSPESNPHPFFALQK
jgi:hypothetical protein